MCRNRLERGGAASWSSSTCKSQSDGMCSFSRGLDLCLHCQNVKNVNICVLGLLQAPEESSVEF